MCNRLRARPIYYHPLREAIKKNIESVIIIIPNGGRGGELAMVISHLGFFCES